MRKRYIRLTYMFRDSIEVYEYLDGRYGARGEKRTPKKKATPEDVRKRNQWNRERTARHKLKTWFEEGDYLITLTYRKSDRPPDMKTAKEHFRNTIRKMRNEYRKRGCELRWMRNIEVGPGGSWHIHVVINRISDADLIVKKAWKFGRVDFKHLYEEGGFRELAGYITKTPETANRYNEKLVETAYYTSRNLPLKEPKKERLVRWKKQPKEKKGYYIEENSYFEGINPITGYKYRYYTMIEPHRRI